MLKFSIMIQNHILRCHKWGAVFFKDVSSEASLISPPVFFSSPSLSPRFKLMPHNTDQWIPANRVRHFVLKYQHPAGGSWHSSVCLSFSSLFLCCSFCTSVPPFFSLPLRFCLSSVCLLYWVEGGGNLAQVLGITYLTIFQTQMKHV